MPAFEEVIRLSLADVKPPEVQRLHAKIAKEGLDEFLSAETPPPPVERYIDGGKGAAEESVKPYGIIRYEFSYLAEVVAFALETVRQRSPVESGRYRDSWFALVDGAETAPEDIPPFAAEVMVTNDQPYARKIEVGHMHLSVPPGIVQAAQQIVRRKYSGIVEATVAFIELAGGYVLKGHRRRRGHGGDHMTYPALVLRFR